MEDEEVEDTKQGDKEMIRLNNQCTISPTNDEESGHVQSLRNDNNSIDE
jgi:hypothetical protein